MLAFGFVWRCFLFRSIIPVGFFVLFSVRLQFVASNCVLCICLDSRAQHAPARSLPAKRKPTHMSLCAMPLFGRTFACACAGGRACVRFMDKILTKRKCVTI